MTHEEFDDLTERLITCIRESADAFFEENGIVIRDWFCYWEASSTDHAQMAREMIFFTADRWPEAKSRQTA